MLDVLASFVFDGHTHRLGFYFIYTYLKGRAELARVLSLSVQLSLRGGDKLLELCLILAFLLV